MKVAVTNLTRLASRHPKCVDLHEEFGLACLVEHGDATTLYLNDRECRSWPRKDHPRLQDIRWFEPDQVIAWLEEDFEALMISAADWRKFSIGSPDKLFLSKNYIFVSYYEGGVRSQSDLLYLHHVVCAFAREGSLALGLEDLMTPSGFRDSFIEIEAGYAFEDRLTFITSSVQDCIWNLDVPKKHLRRIPVPFSTVGLGILSGDDKKACGVFDHRRILYAYPDLPAFEFAVFNLESETSSKQDFATIEKPLIEAGFEMSAIQFQPNSSGKIIVSDGMKAALLEFSEAA
ncbi:MAG: hypothetical protein ACRECP_07610 [Methylocella sp.]